VSEWVEEQQKKIWEGHVNECNFILNLSYSLRVDHECNIIAPIFLQKIKVQRDSQCCWVR